MSLVLQLVLSAEPLAQGYRELGYEVAPVVVADLRLEGVQYLNAELSLGSTCQSKPYRT